MTGKHFTLIKTTKFVLSLCSSLRRTEIRTMNFVIRSQRNSIDIALFAPPEVLLILSQVLFRDICLKSDIADASSDKKKQKWRRESSQFWVFTKAPTNSHPSSIIQKHFTKPNHVLYKIKSQT